MLIATLHCMSTDMVNHVTQMIWMIELCIHYRTDYRGLAVVITSQNIHSKHTTEMEQKQKSSLIFATNIYFVLVLNIHHMYVP